MPEKYGEMSMEDFTGWFDYDIYANLPVVFDVQAQLYSYFGIDAVPAYLMFGADGELLWVYDYIPSNEEVLFDMQTVMDEGW